MLRVSWTGNFPWEESGERARQGLAFTDTRESLEELLKRGVPFAPEGTLLKKGSLPSLRRMAG